MTVYHILMALGVVVVMAIVVKGFWSGDSVRPIEQPDNHYGGGPNGQ
jgi:hypothetical protein